MRPVTNFQASIVACVLVLVVLALPWIESYAIFPIMFPPRATTLTGYQLLFEGVERIVTGIRESNTVWFMGFFLYGNVMLWVFSIYLLVSVVRLIRKASLVPFTKILLRAGVASHLCLAFFWLATAEVYAVVGFWCAFAVYWVLFQIEKGFQSTIT